MRDPFQRPCFTVGVMREHFNQFQDAYLNQQDDWFPVQNQCKDSLPQQPEYQIHLLAARRNERAGFAKLDSPLSDKTAS